MTAFNMTEGRADFLLACVRTHLTTVGNLPPREHTLCAELRAWRDEPDAPIEDTGVLERIDPPRNHNRPRDPMVEAIARELEILYADDAENVLAMNEMTTSVENLKKRVFESIDGALQVHAEDIADVRAELASLRKRLGPSDGDC